MDQGPSNSISVDKKSIRRETYNSFPGFASFYFLNILSEFLSKMREMCIFKHQEYITFKQVKARKSVIRFPPQNVGLDGVFHL